jgi:hypothetical protein
MIRLRLPFAIVLIAAVAAASADSASSTSNAELNSASTLAMSTARVAHTATQLLDGRVLVAGGSPSFITAELYEPAQQAFSPVADMRYGRFWHTATLLASGTVLIAGGQDQSGISLSAAELFIPTPSSGTFTLIHSMTTARVAHTATLLNNDQVLIAGGDPTGTVGTAELFNPATRTFTRTGTMTHPRGGHVAVRLTNGRVLLIGGDAEYNTAEIFDPSTGRFSPTGSMLQARFDFAATLISGGLVLITGGFWGGQVLSSAEIYDPTSGRFSATHAMTVARARHTATTLLNGTVLIAGGRGQVEFNPAFCTPRAFVRVISSVERFNPVTRQFTLSADSMTVGRFFHKATPLITGDVLVTGGDTLRFEDCRPLPFPIPKGVNTPTWIAELIR